MVPCMNMLSLCSEGGKERCQKQLFVKTNRLKMLFAASNVQFLNQGTIQEVRKREFYEKPSVKRKKKSEAARKRKF